MALSETFPAPIIRENIPAARAYRSLIPITARELVEWTYAVQRAQSVRELSLEPVGRSQTGIVVDRLIEFANLGCEIDVSSNAVAIWGETRCHEDALTVHEAVSWLTYRQRYLLITHGLDRSAPDWKPDIFPLRCVPVQGNGGKPRGLYLGSGRKLVGHEIGYEGDWPSRDVADDFRAASDAHKRLWSDPENWPGVYRRRSSRPIVVEHDWSPEPYRRCADEVLQRARDLYLEWWSALELLADCLGSRGLTRYRITDLGAMYEPWNAVR